MNRTITCPSGLSGEVRGIAAKNIEVLADRRLQKSGLLVDKMLAACWLGMTDPGPYQFDDGNVDWQKVLAGDRFYAVMQCRIATYGPKYAFQAQCEDRRCRHPFTWEVDLENDLAVKTFEQADIEAFLAGNRLEEALPDGRKFWFRLATGSEEVKIAKYGEQASAFIPAVVARLHAIEGVKDGGMRSFLENEDMSVAFDILHAMDKHDGGIDTAFMTDCPKCGAVKERNIPFDQGFLIPRASSPRTATAAP